MNRNKSLPVWKKNIWSKDKRIMFWIRPLEILSNINKDLRCRLNLWSPLRLKLRNSLLKWQRLKELIKNNRLRKLMVREISSLRTRWTLVFGGTLISSRRLRLLAFKIWEFIKLWRGKRSWIKKKERIYSKVFSIKKIWKKLRIISQPL